MFGNQYNLQHSSAGQNEILKKKLLTPIYEGDNINHKHFSHFLFEPSPEEPKNEEELCIPLPIKEINESYHIKKLRQMKNKKAKRRTEKNKEKISNLYSINENNLFNICNNIENKKNFIKININKSGQNKENFIEIKEKGKIYNINTNNKNNNLNKSFNSSKIMKKFEKIHSEESIPLTESKDDFEINLKINITNL